MRRAVLDHPTFLIHDSADEPPPDVVLASEQPPPDALAADEESDAVAVAQLARRLTEFDDVLALELRDHLVARGDQWADGPQASRAERARRYRLLAQALRS